MDKPVVRNKDLAKLFNDMWRPGAKIGNGSTGAAVRFTELTGKLVGGSDHIAKAEQYSVALERWLAKNQEASAYDRQSATDVWRDLRNTLKGT